MKPTRRVVVVGAGVAGLACARELGRNPSIAVQVVEQSRGLGGRAATRRIEDQPVDHGLPFYHGSDARFLGALDELDPASRTAGWPRRVEGTGRPCQPRAFRAGERRLAFAAGATAFPKHLARGIDLRLEARVVGLRLGDAGIELEVGDGLRVAAEDVVLALPAPECAELVAQVADESRELAGALHLLRRAALARCLVAATGYPRDVPAPEWDVRHPEDSRVLQTISHDSSKRTSPAWTVLVLQAHGSWSARNWDREADAFGGDLMAEAARLLGKWVERPAWTATHRWRYARIDPGTELAGPLVVRLARGARIGVAGEMFWPGGGVQGAFCSGVALARRMTEERPR